MLFSNIKFHLTPSFPPQRVDALTKFLTSNGAEKVAIEEASHIVADSLKFEGRASAKEGVVVVSVSIILVVFPGCIFRPTRTRPFRQIGLRGV